MCVNLALLQAPHFTCLPTSSSGSVAVLRSQFSVHRLGVSENRIDPANSHLMGNVRFYTSVFGDFQVSLSIRRQTHIACCWLYIASSTPWTEFQSLWSILHEAIVIISEANEFSHLWKLNVPRHIHYLYVFFVRTEVAIQRLFKVYIPLLDGQVSLVCLDSHEFQVWVVLCFITVLGGNNKESTCWCLITHLPSNYQWTWDLMFILLGFQFNETNTHNS